VDAGSDAPLAASAQGERGRLETVPIESIAASTFEIPTDAPEADGTLAWTKTTLVVVEARAGGLSGLGYTYGDAAGATLVAGALAGLVRGLDALSPPAAWVAMQRQVRNLGHAGIATMAIAAVDVALWDLKAKLLGAPLATLLGAVRDRVPVYGSGGFTSYSPARLAEQLEGWVARGIRAVKMKIGARPEEDLERVHEARAAVGAETALMVDANGAFDRKQALRFADALATLDVRWFEEPVSSDDFEGLRLLRDRAPAAMDIAAGEYGYDLFYFRRMLAAGAVDVLQADATRCGGITGFLKVAALCEAWNIPLSAHTAPALHLHACCAVGPLRPLEYFHDHARIERMLFDGAREPVQGRLEPDWTRPGIGLELKKEDARRFAL
jgi:L-alanine-DL-glutamate epimerase-like enolase superfamily enzyme